MEKHVQGEAGHHRLTSNRGTSGKGWPQVPLGFRHLLARVFKYYHRCCRRIERWRENIVEKGGASQSRYSRNEVTVTIMCQIE